MNQIVIITSPEDLTVDWTADPAFRFATEVDALSTLSALADELAAAREQLGQTMRYMAAAVTAARVIGEDGRPISSKQAIIGHSGLARQTVYNILGDQAAHDDL